MIVSSFIRGYLSSMSSSTMQMYRHEGIWLRKGPLSTLLKHCLKDLVAHDMYVAVDAICTEVEGAFGHIFDRHTISTTLRPVDLTDIRAEEMAGLISNEIAPLLREDTRSSARIMRLLGVALGYCFMNAGRVK